MSSKLLSRPAEGVAFVPVNDEAILFDQYGQRLFHLNAAAACIWSHLTGERDDDAVAQAVAESMCLERSQARHFVHDMLNAWRGMGLLQDSCSFFPPERCTEALDQMPPAAGDEELYEFTPPRRRHYRFLDSMFSLGFSSAALEELAQPVFRHLETDREPESALHLDIVETSKGIRVIHSRQVIGRCACARELAPLLHGLVGLLAIRNYEYLFAIHASGLVSSGSALILAGKSGSGKTTMAAALLAAGWEYMSDDTVLLLPTLNCVAVPYALTLKRGAWPILRSYFPAIDKAYIHRRSDAQAVRYLCPGGGHDFAKDRPVRWIGFPHRSMSSTSSMRSLDQIEGLCRLLQHCCAVPSLLTSANIQGLVQWSAHIRFFEFAIVHLDEAVAQVEAMTRGENNDRSTPLPTLTESRKAADRDTF